MSKRDYYEWLTRLSKRERKEAEAWVDSLDRDIREDFFTNFGFSRGLRIEISAQNDYTVSLGAWEDTDNTDIPDALVYDPWESVDDKIDGVDEASLFDARLETLSPRQSEVYQLYYCEGLTLRDIAELCRICFQRVGQITIEIRKKLADTP